ncbi:hypothetical protein P7K49_014162, partial [Saguinus oedipus]
MKAAPQGKSKVCAGGSPPSPALPPGAPARPPAGQGAQHSRLWAPRARTHQSLQSHRRSLWEPPSPELPERKKDGGVCLETTHSSVWQPGGDSGSSALKDEEEEEEKEEEEEEEEEETAQSDAICCTPLRSHWLPGASGCHGARGRGASGSHLAPRLPRQLLPAAPSFSLSLPPPFAWHPQDPQLSPLPRMSGRGSAALDLSSSAPHN